MHRRPHAPIDVSHVIPDFVDSDEGAHAFADATYGTVLPCAEALHAHVHQLRRGEPSDTRSRLHRRFWQQQQQQLEAEIAEEEARRAKRAKKKQRKKRAQELRRAQREMDAAFDLSGRISALTVKES